MSYVEEVSRELYDYNPPLTKRPDFDEFWEETIILAKGVPLNATLELYDYPSPYADVYSITYCGFDETPIHGWYMVPKFAGKDKYPCLIHYHGYTGSSGKPADFMQWIMMGVCVISIDCRGQSGLTGDYRKFSSGYTQSAVCKGVLDKYEYYYRAVYMDCIKAIDFALAMPEVDGDKILIEGGSQGGALGMAVCSLDDRPYLAMLDVPSNSNIEKRIAGFHGSYSAVADYLKIYPDNTEKVFETLSYFDTMNMADRIKCRILISVGLKDQVCPAKMYFASYNRIISPKEIRIYPFNGHEGGSGTHNEIKLRFLSKYI